MGKKGTGSDQGPHICDKVKNVYIDTGEYKVHLILLEVTLQGRLFGNFKKKRFLYFAKAAPVLIH